MYVHQQHTFHFQILSSPTTPFHALSNDPCSCLHTICPVYATYSSLVAVSFHHKSSSAAVHVCTLSTVYENNILQWACYSCFIRLYDLTIQIFFSEKDYVTLACVLVAIDITIAAISSVCKPKKSVQEHQKLHGESLSSRALNCQIRIENKERHFRKC